MRVSGIWHTHCYNYSKYIFIDREAREIMYLVASVRPSVRPSALSRQNRLTYDLDIWYVGSKLLITRVDRNSLDNNCQGQANTQDIGRWAPINVKLQFFSLTWLMSKQATCFTWSNLRHLVRESLLRLHMYMQSSTSILSLLCRCAVSKS